MRSEWDVGSKVKYEVTVSNQGQSLNTLGSAFLNIMWPHEITNGKWLLYPMRVELEGGQGPGQKGLCSRRPRALYLTCAHRYESRQRVDQILETRDVIGRCFVLSQDLAIHDELDAVAITTAALLSRGAGESCMAVERDGGSKVKYEVTVVSCEGPLLGTERG
ncbi:Integrin alpha-7 [Camelus dromedarius]|uniref:Integrin alpha-7 n=1 Tax=Camelus dromedarius TaxID=9838 RepID=A0A5N4DGA9_CAMDR|nr:Integrin alpha-7 [Camelus dromedarius]